jgi:Arc/MetJ family transcription regulator
MRTTLDIDEDLLRQAQARSGKKTKSATINEALNAYLREASIEELVSLRGSLRARGE